LIPASWSRSTAGNGRKEPIKGNDVPLVSQRTA
jgi:hypothetical protein